MRILLLPQHADAESEGIKVDLRRIPSVGEFITTDGDAGGDWHRVELVALMPDGAQFAAKIVSRRFSIDEVRSQAVGGSAPEQFGQPCGVQLLMEEEAAAIANVHPRTIRRLIERGKLPATNYGLGRKCIYRIKPEDLAKVQPVERRPPRERRGRRPAVDVTGNADVTSFPSDAENATMGKA